MQNCKEKFKSYKKQLKINWKIKEMKIICNNQNRGCMAGPRVQIIKVGPKSSHQAHFRFVWRESGSQNHMEHIQNIFHLFHMLIRLNWHSSLLSLPPPHRSSPTMVVKHHSTKLHMPKCSTSQALPETTINFTWISINFPDRARKS